MATESILIVEPDAEVAALLTLILEEEGYQTTAVGSLDEAKRMLAQGHFDLVITEALGQSDDLDVDPAFLKEFRSADAVNGNVPVILCSASFVHPRRVRTIGLADVVAKPFQVEDLLQKVQALLREAGTRSSGR